MVPAVAFMSSWLRRNHTIVQKEKEDEGLHTEMQYHLLKIGNA